MKRRGLPLAIGDGGEHRRSRSQTYAAARSRLHAASNSQRGRLTYVAATVQTILQFLYNAMHILAMQNDD